VLNHPITSESGFIPPHVSGQLASVLAAVEAALRTETGQRRLLPVQDYLVSDKLRRLPAASTLTPTQQHLLDETIRCLESGAYRSAAVMGWNMCYECIRWWMWNDSARRAAFNSKLMSQTDRRGNVIYPAGIVAYDEFYSIKPTLGERDVLDTMKDAGLLTGVYEPLAGRLRERNSYAHANDLVPSVYQANYYIEGLVDLLRSPPFI
jgi:hypothetical protein